MSDIRVEYSCVMESAIGKENGLAEDSLRALQWRASNIHKKLVRKRKSGKLPFYELPYKTKDAKKIVSEAKRIQKNFKAMVVLGIGGSALGTTALFDALCHSEHNSLSAKKRQGVKLYVADNIDPDSFSELISTLKLKETIFNVISKSGSTAETMAQFMIVTNLLKKKIGRGWKKHLLLTTDVKSGALRKIADDNKLKTFIVPEGVGGRFTVFTPVSLLPTACAGVDILSLLKGARAMDKRCAGNKVLQNPAYLFAACNYLLDTTKAKKMIVMMPYSGKLYSVADWFRQMWAESLGKRQDDDGNLVFVGQTPIKALGATDQHSQVQLYVEGPFDKVFCFLEVLEFATDVPIPKGFEDLPGVSYLGGHSLAELLNTEKRGTEYALTKNKRPSMTIKLAKVDAHSLGQVLYMLEVATAFAGGLYRVNPFDQPGVEFGKEYAYAMLGREGFEEKRKEFEKEEGGGG